MTKSIEWKTTGDLLEEPAQALVNTVNTVGVMGKGVALQFKNRFRANYNAYVLACKRGEVQIGRMFITEVQELTTNDYIINFPTKKDFKYPSRMEYIEMGLTDLARIIQEYNIESIALPPLGAGLGRLNWADVKPAIERHLAPVAQAGVRVTAFEPNPNYDPKSSRPEQKNVELTPWRVLMLEALRSYIDIHFGATLIELHKMAYLIHRLDSQPSSDPGFVAWNYGPYSHRIHHALNDLDGTWLTGMKDLEVRYNDPIEVKADRIDEIEQARQNLLSQEQQQQLQEIQELISGFETPYGLELLTTVDWVMKELPQSFTDPKVVCEAVYSWPRKALRKREIMSERHIGIAQKQLLRFAEALRYGQ